MTRKLIGLTIAMLFCLAASLAQGAPHEREEPNRSSGREQPGHSSTERKPEGEQHEQSSQRKPTGEQSNEPFGQEPAGESSGGSAPGGDWSQRMHSGKQSPGQPGNMQQPGHAGAAGYEADQNKKQPTGAQGAAAGAAVTNRNELPASGAQGAAAGAAVENRNQPQMSGAEGAAAGAAVANRNQPQMSGAQGAALGAAAANNNQPAMSGAGGAAAGYAAVQNSFNNSNVYGQQWYGAHPGAWAPAGWDATAAWQPTSWNAVATQVGYGNAAPISYDYGVNVVAQDGNVMVNGQSVGTTTEFSQQAADLAAAGTASDVTPTDKWMPLGVYAMVRDEQQKPQLIVQLAINKDGMLRGNYTDQVSDSTMPVHGAVDKNTQRAAWMVGDNKHTVMEAGLSDLTGSEAPALIHNNGKTDHWLLIRLAQPNQGGNGAAN